MALRSKWGFFAVLTLLLRSGAGYAQGEVLATSEVRPQSWRYVTRVPPGGWQQPRFDDGGWQVGSAPFGANMAGVRTPWADTPGDIYLRRSFTLRKTPALPFVELLHDDEAEVYVDGVLAAHANSATTTYDLLLVTPEARALLTPGVHTLAVHCHQISGGQIIDAGITDFGASPARQTPTRDTFSDTWVAHDGLGRSVIAGGPEGALHPNRTVGVFYFIANHVPNGTVYDITKLIAANPGDPQYGPVGAPEWWSRPWFGYYQSNDEAVIRKHLQMLADAGVDVIVFDNTNGPTYPDVYLPLCRVMEKMRSEGNPTPKIAFFAGHGAWNTLYRDFYGANLFPDLWFRWKGKPLLMAHFDGPEKLPTDVASFFNVRESWAWTPGGWFGDGKDKWPWLDNYPQNYGWHEDPKRPEEVAVETAQHATTSIGRSSLAQREPPVDSLRLTPQTAVGLCFAQQIERALKIDPEFVFVTGWNEWTAGRFTQEGNGVLAGRPNPVGAPVFVDEYNEEFSRDIEPEQGRLQDDYYYQFVDFVRRYKGARSVAPVTLKRISLAAGFAQWADVGPEFRDDIGDPIHRNSPGWGRETYVNQTGRNDIVAAKVTADRDNVYFYVRTQDKMTPPTDPNWMLLYLNTDSNDKTGWLGYDFVVNRKVGKKTATIEANVGGKYAWRPVGEVKYVLRGKELMLAIPRALIGVRGAGAIDLKWADNIQQTGEASDFTLNGDAAPNDRFNYRARLTK